jgi:hypothetical protein
VPKFTGEGDIVISVPLPLSARTCGLPQASSITVIVALRFPRADGVNVTVIVHFVPTASDVPHVFDVIEKSVLLVPPSMMLLIVSAA